MRDLFALLAHMLGKEKDSVRAISTHKPSHLWCSNCKSNVTVFLSACIRDGKEMKGICENHENCKCTLGEFKTNLIPEAIRQNYWRTSQ